MELQDGIGSEGAAQPPNHASGKDHGVPTGLATELVDRVTHRVVRHAELDAVLRHRHAAYLRSGIFAPRADGLLRDEHDDRDDTHTVVTRLDDEIAGSLRVQILSERNMDTYTCGLFPDAVRRIVVGGTVAIDCNRATTDEAVTKRHRGFHFHALRPAMLAAAHYGAEWILAPVQERHAAFYSRGLAGRPVSDPIVAPGTEGCVALLMGMHVPSMLRRRGARLAFMLPRRGETDDLFG